MWAKFFTEKNLDEVNKRDPLTENEAESLAHDNTLWIVPKNEDYEKVYQRKIGAPQHWLCAVLVERPKTWCSDASGIAM